MDYTLNRKKIMYVDVVNIYKGKCMKRRMLIFHPDVTERVEETKVVHGRNNLI